MTASARGGFGVVVLALIGCGAEPPPTCERIERALTVVARADRARMVAVLDAGGVDLGAFTPVLDRAAVSELVGRCRDGALPATTRRCLARARAAIDVDRCVALLVPSDPR